uniref:Si:dkey-16j16.4 n=1 Tax=Gadus morhua TaxID=8049 RepID=A0A8C5FBP7_GADMO
MLKTLTKKLRRHSLNEIHPFQLKISYHGSGEGFESDDSEGENQELAQIDRERRRNCGLTPLATSQQHNQGPLSPARLRRLRLLLDANLDRHSSEEELERISRIGEGRKWASALHQRHGDRHSSASSDEEVRDLCGAAGGGGAAGSGGTGVIGCVSPVNPANPSRPLVVVEQPGAHLAASPSPVLFSSSPPHSLMPPPLRFQLQVVQPVARPILLTHFDQSAAPYRRNRHGHAGEPRRPSLDLEKMQQKMLLKKNCGGKTRSIKIRVVSRSQIRLDASPASWRSTPLASKMRQDSRQHWMAASFFFPVWVTSATSCLPEASSTGSLEGTQYGHELLDEEPRAVVLVLVFKLQLLS